MSKDGFTVKGLFSGEVQQIVGDKMRTYAGMIIMVKESNGQYLKGDTLMVSDTYEDEQGNTTYVVALDPKEYFNVPVRQKVEGRQFKVRNSDFDEAWRGR